MLKNVIIKNLIDNGIQFIVLAPTHKAVENLNGTNGITNCIVSPSVGFEVSTIGSVTFKTEHETNEKYLARMMNHFRGKTVIIDEIALCSKRDIETLYTIKLLLQTQMNIIASGDFSQCQSGDGSNINYENTTMLKYLCDSKVMYLTTVHRYDNELSKKCD